MKKLLAICLSVLLLCSAIPFAAVSVSAEEGINIVVEVSEEEVNAAKNAIKTLGGQIEKVVDYAIPGTDVQHRLIFIKKIKETPKKYPRAFAKIKKNPL